MSIMSDFDGIINFLHRHLQESRKADFKRHEIRNPILLEDEKDTSSSNAVVLQLVSKLYLLHDIVTNTDRLMSKCFIKRFKHNECTILKQFYPDKDYNIITNVVNNLSDTKYGLILSPLSYEILNTVIKPDTITKAFWYKSNSPVIIITNNVYQIRLQDNLDVSFRNHNQTGDNIICSMSSSDSASKNCTNFEAKLLQLLAAVSNVNQTIPVTHDYTFWIFKIEKLMFAVLLPRYESKKNFLINVWPIMPVSVFFNINKIINNLKVSKSDKDLFQSIAATIRPKAKSVNMINFKKEILNGITLPLLIQNRINLNTLYMTFFFEFIQENVHFQFALPKNSTADYLKCRHCTTIFNNIFDFVRHWWNMKQKQIFKCHICDERVTNLSKLGSHYRQKHYNFINSHKNRMVNSRSFQRNTNFCHNKDPINFESPRIRQCLYCKICKEDLNSMRNHLRLEHISDLIASIVHSVRNTGLRIFEVLDPFYSCLKNPFYLHMIDLDSAFSRKSFTWEQFLILFKYRVQCPFCVAAQPKTYKNSKANNDKILEVSYGDWLKYLTHIAREHCHVKLNESENFKTEEVDWITEGTSRVKSDNCGDKQRSKNPTDTEKNDDFEEEIEEDSSLSNSYLTDDNSLSSDCGISPYNKRNKVAPFNYDKYDKNKILSQSSDSHVYSDTLHMLSSPTSMIPNSQIQIVEIPSNSKSHIAIKSTKTVIKQKEEDSETWMTDKVEYFN